MMRYFYLLFFLQIFFLTTSNGQSVQRQCVASAGTSVAGNGTYVGQTVGQPYGTSAFYSNEIRFTPGFQQPPSYKVENIKSVISAQIFPNPAAQQVMIETAMELQNVRFQIVDMNGKILLSEEVGKFKSYSVNCSAWADGTYFITLLDSEHELYSSKLIVAR
jgi:hypothetical protein